MIIIFATLFSDNSSMFIIDTAIALLLRIVTALIQVYKNPKSSPLLLRCPLFGVSF